MFIMDDAWYLFLLYVDHHAMSKLCLLKKVSALDHRNFHILWCPQLTFSSPPCEKTELPRISLHLWLTDPFSLLCALSSLMSHSAFA
ncbi:hypothetical protein Hanom_Chr16g01482781 [Helianthus anomalus]